MKNNQYQKNSCSKCKKQFIAPNLCIVDGAGKYGICDTFCIKCAKNEVKKSMNVKAYQELEKYKQQLDAFFDLESICDHYDAYSGIYVNAIRYKKCFCAPIPKKSSFLRKKWSINFFSGSRFDQNCAECVIRNHWIQLLNMLINSLDSESTEKLLNIYKDYSEYKKLEEIYRIIKTYKSHAKIFNKKIEDVIHSH